MAFGEIERGSSARPARKISRPAASRPRQNSDQTSGPARWRRMPHAEENHERRRDPRADRPPDHRCRRPPDRVPAGRARHPARAGRRGGGDRSRLRDLGGPPHAHPHARADARAGVRALAVVGTPGPQHARPRHRAAARAARGAARRDRHRPRRALPHLRPRADEPRRRRPAPRRRARVQHLLRRGVPRPPRQADAGRRSSRCTRPRRRSPSSSTRPALGLDAFMFGGPLLRPVPGLEHRAARWLDTLGVDSLHDYDPVWTALRRARRRAHLPHAVDGLGDRTRRRPTTSTTTSACSRRAARRWRARCSWAASCTASRRCASRSSRAAWRGARASTRA